MVVYSPGYILFSASTPKNTPEITSPDPPKPSDDREEANVPKIPKPDDGHRDAALENEISWVESGGVLRDPKTGLRDMERTKAIRVEVTLRKKEKEWTRKWEEYEARWKSLVESTGPVKFGDIPWPTDGEVTLVNVERFLLDPLQVRGCKTTKKQRIRSSLLRYHPDRLSSIMSRVVDDDKQKVVDRLGAVIVCLKQLSDELR